MTEEDHGATSQSLVGRELEERRIRDCLNRAEYGVLSLADGGGAYGTPLSFGYAEDLSELYFLLAFETKSTKRAYLETTETATFTVTDSNLPDAWESVIVRAPSGASPTARRRLPTAPSPTRPSSPPPPPSRTTSTACRSTRGSTASRPSP